ncbi:MAG: NUDIX domain-containing protein [Chloroflexota bacterium]|nr:NUDIX domain-containing protein [Chloroflexota bacterium]
MPLSEYIKHIRAKIGNDLLLLPGVTAVVINDHDELLLQLRRDTKTWAPPSGGLEPGENLAQCVIREVREETGIEVIPESIIAVLSGDDFTVTYPNGDQIGVVSCVFRCRPSLEATPRVNDDESLAMRYFDPKALPENMLPRHRWIIAKALGNDRDTYFNPPS